MKSTLFATMIGLAALGLAGCQLGGAEKAGQTVDNAGKAVVDTITPTGPVQKVGKKIDEATSST